MLLKGRKAIVTGSNRGIGKAIVKILAKNGADVWACTRNFDDHYSHYLDSLAEEMGVNILPVYFDLADVEQVKEGVKKIIAAKQPVDILINNAGIIFTALFQMTTMEKMKEDFEINLFSQLFLTQQISRIMSRQKSGSIINVSSSAAIEGNEGRLAYASAKAAMIASTKVMAKELAKFNIRVNAIAPGLTETDMMRNSTTEHSLEKTLERTCMKRVGRPEEIANVVLFLSSDLSSYMTSQVLRVDGGM
jgi:3-oxoacyl-[acyl-carrier protein] reductase